MTVHDLTSKAAFDQALKDHKIVILDATASWCGPCKAMSPILDKLSDNADFADIFFAKFDVDNVPDLTQELGIRAMPSFFAFKNGEEAGKLVGANPPALQALVSKSLL